MDFALILAFLIGLYVPGTACPTGCECYYETDTDMRVDCIGKEIMEIPDELSHNTTKLYLQDTSISYIPNKKLANLTKLELLDLKDSLVETIHSDAFMNLNQLSILVLEKNKLQNIPANAFGKIAALKELNLAHNTIQQVSDNAFTGLSLLGTLLLSHNHISTINTNSFSGLNNLIELKLDSNQLTSLVNQFGNLGKLSQLDLKDNKISALSSNSFGSITSLNALDISSNSITNIGCSTFQSVHNLRSLGLSSNKLSEPPSCVLEQLNQLETLDLSGNNFVSVQDRAFISVPSLLHLRLNNMPSLLTISKDVFQGLSQIESLSMHSNPNLTQITQDHIKATSHPRLTELLLHGNGLRHLEEDTLLTQSMLLKATLHGNPLLCNCSLKWIAKVIKNYLHHPWAAAWVNYAGSPICGSPPNMEGLMFKDLIEDDLTCDKPQLNPVSAVRQTAYRGLNSSIVVHTFPGQPGSIWNNPQGQKLSPGDEIDLGRVYVLQELLADHKLQSGYYISNVTDADEGRYTLQVFNAGGDVTHDFFLDVTDAPPPTGGPASSADNIFGHFESCVILLFSSLCVFIHGLT